MSLKFLALSTALCNAERSHKAKIAYDRSAGGASCTSDLSCNLNGVCINGQCVCDAAWEASNCSVLALRPLLPEAEAGFNLTNATTGEHVSTWGGPVLQVPGDDARWHMHAALMDRGCGLTSWMSNSLVVHAVASSPAGPYRLQDVSLPAWSHNPGTAVVESEGKVLMFHVGAGDGLGSEVTCTPTGCCASGRSPCGLRHGCNSTPPVTWTPPRERELPGCASESCRDGRCWFGNCGGGFTNVSFHVATSPAGPWSAVSAPLVGGQTFGSMTTPSPWMYRDPHTGEQNGTIFLVSGGLWRAESWRGPYGQVPGLHVSCHGEDPYVYQDHRGHWHCLSHDAGSAGFGNLSIAGGHAFSLDLREWCALPELPTPTRSKALVSTSVAAQVHDAWRGVQRRVRRARGAAAATDREARAAAADLQPHDARDHAPRHRRGRRQRLSRLHRQGHRAGRRRALLVRVEQQSVARLP